MSSARWISTTVAAIPSAVAVALISLISSAVLGYETLPMIARRRRFGTSSRKNSKRFSDKVSCLKGQSRNIASWSGEARNEAAADRVVRDSKDDWNAWCRLHCRPDRDSSSYNYVNLELNE